MQYSNFVTQVRQRARLTGSEEAEAAATATLETLAERLNEGAVEKLTSHLPREVAALFRSGAVESGQRFDFDEFVERIAEKADLDDDDALRQARAVIEVLSDQLSSSLQDWLPRQLPSEFDRLFVAGSSTLRRGALSVYDDDEEEDE